MQASQEIDTHSSTSESNGTTKGYLEPAFSALHRRFLLPTCLLLASTGFFKGR